MRVLGLGAGVTPERRLEVSRSIEDLSTPTRSFYILVALSTTIAGYGLLANSTAVVIGAMLVAPLMGPIFGVALGLSTGDRRLLRIAGISEAAGVVLAVALGLAIGLMPLRLGFGSEILARTQPTLYDLIIALASGLAGAYAIMHPKISPALPGVAIATALVPPLATCGLCLSAGRWDGAAGAFLLFLANFLAIEIAAAFVFTSMGMATANEPLTVMRFARQFRASIVLLAAIGLFMTRTLTGLIDERRLSRSVERILAREAGTITGGRLTESDVVRHNGRIEVMATVLTPQEIDPAQIARIEDLLDKAVGPRVHLVVRSLISRDADRGGPVFLPDGERTRRVKAAEQSQFLARAARILNSQVAAVPGAQLVDLKRDETGVQTTLTAVVRAPTALEPAQVAEIESALRKELNTGVRLVVRSVLTRDADAQQFLYAPKEEPEPLTGPDLALRRRLQGALERQIAARVPGAGLAEFRFAHRPGGRLLVLAVARTPRQFQPADAEAIERLLRDYVDPKTDLVLRSIVGVDAASSGFLTSFDESKLTP